MDEQLAALDALPTERSAKTEALQRALLGRHYRVVAKAARTRPPGAAMGAAGARSLPE